MGQFSEFIRVAKADLSSLIAVVALISQLAFLKPLFDPRAETLTLYSLALGLFILLGAIGVNHLREIRRSNSILDRRKHLLLCVLCWGSATISLYPAIQRWRLLNTHFDHKNNVPRPPIEIGAFFPFGFMPDIPNVKKPSVTLYLDPLRTSMRCIDGDVNGCLNYSIPDSILLRAQHFRPYDEHGDRLVFERTYFSALELPAYRALTYLADYRERHEPLLEQNDAGDWYAWLHTDRAKFLNAGLLPDAAEWMWLTDAHPQNAEALHRILSEWIGIPDPFFHAMFTNPTSETIEIASVDYNVKPLKEIKKANMEGAYEISRYRIPLRIGRHREPLNPHVLIMPHSGQAIDLIFTMQSPSAGETFDIEVAFSTVGTNSTLAAHPFRMTFWKE